MKNPLSPEQKYLRDSIIRSLIEVAEKNWPFFESFRVFDQGKVWSKKTTPSERTVMWCLFWNREDASFPANEFLEMKWMINDLFRPDILTYQKTEYAFFHPVQQGSIILNGKNVWYLWVVHPMVLESIKLPAHGQLVVCEIDMDAYLSFSLQKTQEEKAYESLQDQIIRKDLSVLVPRQQWFGLVAQILQDIPSITSVTLFDIYEGDGIPSDKKSISVSFKIHRTQQITSEEIQQIMQTAIQKLEEQWVTLRK